MDTTNRKRIETAMHKLRLDCLGAADLVAVLEIVHKAMQTANPDGNSSPGEERKCPSCGRYPFHWPK